MKVLPLTTADLCCGAAGGWTLGLHRAGYRVIAACENDDWRREIFAQRWGVPVCPDLRALHSEWWLEHVGPVRPFLLCGSPPCKEYSSANHKGGGLDADDLFLECVRVAGLLRPPWLAFENSPRIRTKGFDRIAGALETIGYTGWPLVVGVANAAAAHRRARVWIVAFDADGDGQSRLPVDGQMGGRLGQVHPDGDSADEPRQAEFAGTGRWWKSRAQGGERDVVGVGTHSDNQQGFVEQRTRGSVSGQGPDDRRVHRGEPEIVVCADAAGEQGRAAGLARQRGSVSADGNRGGLRIEHGRRIGPDWREAPISFDAGAIMGPVGSLPLGEHIRAYHGVSSGLAELCRAAYGDAVAPIIPELIGRAIRSVAS